MNQQRMKALKLPRPPWSSSVQAWRLRKGKQASTHRPWAMAALLSRKNSPNWNYPSVSQLQLNASPLVWLANNDIVESRLSIFPIIHLHVVLWWQVKHASWLKRARSLFAHLTTQVCLHMLSSPVSGIMQQPFRKWQSNAFDWSLGSLMAQSMAMHTKSKYSTLTPPSFAMKSLKMFNDIVVTCCSLKFQFHHQIMAELPEAPSITK